MHRGALAVAVVIAGACTTCSTAGEPKREYKQAVYYAENGSVYTWVDSPVTYQLRQLWRLDERGTWQPVSVPKRALHALTLVPTGEKVSLGLAEGDYFAVATVEGHSECQHFGVSKKHCTDVMLPPPPAGQVPACLAGGRAGYVPNPMDLKLPDGTGVRAACGNNGFLSSENTRRNGVLDGPARGYDVHGKVVWSGTYRDGKLSGVVTEWLRDTRFETPYVDDKRHGTQKGFDASGRLVSRTEFVNGVYTSQETHHPNGAVASRVTMKGDIGSWTHYSPSGAKTMEGRIVKSVSGSAHQCIIVYDAEGRSHPCPSPPEP